MNVYAGLDGNMVITATRSTTERDYMIAKGEDVVKVWMPDDQPITLRNVQVEVDALLEPQPPTKFRQESHKRWVVTHRSLTVGIIVTNQVTAATWEAVYHGDKNVHTEGDRFINMCVSDTESGAITELQEGIIKTYDIDTSSKTVTLTDVLDRVTEKNF